MICFGEQRWVNNLFTYYISGESDCETSRRTLILKHVVRDGNTRLYYANRYVTN